MDLIVTMLLVPLFIIWSDDGPHMVYYADDLETYCNHMHSDGCTVPSRFDPDRLDVIVNDPFMHTPKGCNVLTHEWWHLMGYAENEIALCGIPSQEFRHDG